MKRRDIERKFEDRMELDLNVSPSRFDLLSAHSDKQSRKVSNEHMTSTIIALQNVFQGNQEYLSNSLDQLQAAIEEMKRTPEALWDEVRSEGRDVVAQVGHGIQAAMDKTTVQATDEVSQIVMRSG